MPTRPSPPETVPEFVVERFADHDPETLLDIVAYEADRVRSTSYARDLAAYKESDATGEATADAQTTADGGQSPETDGDSGGSDDEDDDDPSRFSTGPMFG